MMLVHCQRYRPGEINVLQNIKSHLGMHFYHLEFYLREASRLAQYLRWDRDLSDVMNRTRNADTVNSMGGIIHMRGDGTRQVGYAAVMAGRARIHHPEDQGESMDCLAEGFSHHVEAFFH